MKPRLWTLSYDIATPQRLRRVARLAETHGERVQKSLFLCPLAHDALHSLHRRLGDTLHPQEDRALLRPVCRTCHGTTRIQGAGAHPEQAEPFWII